MYTLNKSIENNPPNLAQYMPYDEVNGFDPLNSEFRRRLPELKTAGRVIISSKYEYRLDLLSFDLYGSTAYWWILLDYNYLDTPFQITVGRELAYPSQYSILDLFYSMSNYTSTLVDSDRTTIPKQTDSTFIITPDYIEFEWDSSNEKSINISPVDIIQSVTFTVSSDDFRVRRIFRRVDGAVDYMDGYFTVVPTGLNLSEDSDIEGEIVFKLYRFGKTTEKKVKIIQKRPKQSITLSVYPTALTFNGEGGTQKVTIAPEGYEDELVVTSDADWCTADAQGNVTVEPTNDSN